jgi:hypothetical protein
VLPGAHSESSGRDWTYTFQMNLQTFSKVKPSAPLVLFITGGLSLLLWLFLHRKSTLLLVFGGITWVAAYFCVVAENYRRRAPVPTRGGLLRYEENPRLYRFVHGFMLFLGLFFLVVFLTLNIFGTR